MYSPSCITIALPRMEWGPRSRARWSTMLSRVLPDNPVSMLPRSPMCLAWACCKWIRGNILSIYFLTFVSGAPWLVWNGLKCPPAALHLSRVSPNWWTWNPCRPGDRPAMVPLKLKLEMEEYLKSSELSYNSILIFTELSGRCPALFWFLLSHCPDEWFHNWLHLHD